MPGRRDFGILRSSFFSDARALRAATLYVERGLAVAPHGFATVSGHVVLFGLWAMRETDDGVLPEDGIAAAYDALRLSPEDCTKVIAALVDAKLLRRVPDGLYLVGFEDCYSQVLGKRRRDRDRPRGDIGATSERHRGDIAPTSELHRSDVGAIEPDASGRSDIGATSRDVAAVPGTRARAGADRAVPFRAVPDRTEPPLPPDAGTNGHGGGNSPSAPPAERNGHDPVALAPDDLGVFEMLWRRREKLGAADRTECDRLTEDIRAKAPNAEAIRAFVDRMTPSFVDEVVKVRRSFRMAANGRKTR